MEAMAGAGARDKQPSARRALSVVSGTRKLYFSHPDPQFELFRKRLRIWCSLSPRGSPPPPLG